MNRRLHAQCLVAGLALLSMPAAEAVVINSYLGWNYLSSSATAAGTPVSAPILDLTRVDYTGASGALSQTIDFTGSGGGMRDGATGVVTAGQPTYSTYMDSFTGLPGDGETTRVSGVMLPIDWIPAGQLTPWGQTYAFPTIGINGLIVDIPGSLTGIVVTTPTPYVVGLNDWGGAGAFSPIGPETGNPFADARGDIYRTSRIAGFSLVSSDASVTGSGNFAFAAAAVQPIPGVPIPAAAWLFGSGLLGLSALGKRERA